MDVGTADPDKHPFESLTQGGEDRLVAEVHWLPAPKDGYNGLIGSVVPAGRLYPRAPDIYVMII